MCEPRVDYINGVCLTLPNWDIDEINSIDLGRIVRNIGYVNFNVWYRHPALGLDIGCKPFKDDSDVYVFLNDVRGHEVINFYVEHIVDEESEIIEEVPLIDFTPADVEGGKGSV